MLLVATRYGENIDGACFSAEINAGKADERMKLYLNNKPGAS